MPRLPSAASSGASTRDSASVAGRDLVNTAIAGSSNCPSASATSTPAAARNATRPSAGRSRAHTATVRTGLTSSGIPTVATLSTAIGNLISTALHQSALVRIS